MQEAAKLASEMMKTDSAMAQLMNCELMTVLPLTAKPDP
jgi:hypothetical protein